jgi:hypothetical protein
VEGEHSSLVPIIFCCCCDGANQSDSLHEKLETPMWKIRELVIWKIWHTIIYMRVSSTW